MNNKDTVYKIHIAGYNPEKKSLLCSFSAEGITKYDAQEYESMNYDIDTLGNRSVQDVIKEICKTAPPIIEGIKVRESFEITTDKEREFEAVVGHDYEYTEEQLFPLVHKTNPEITEEDPWLAEVAPENQVAQKESNKV